MDFSGKVRAFSPEGPMIVGIFDNVLSVREIADVRLDGESGAVSFGFAEGGASGGADGADQPATRDGFPLYRCRLGKQWREDEIVLRAVDAAGSPVGEPLRFKPAKLSGEGIMAKDDALYERAAELLAAARAVVANWERGDLAGAVHALEGAAEHLAEIVVLDADADGMAE